VHRAPVAAMLTWNRGGGSRSSRESQCRDAALAALPACHGWWDVVTSRSCGDMNGECIICFARAPTSGRVIQRKKGSGAMCPLPFYFPLHRWLIRRASSPTHWGGRTRTCNFLINRRFGVADHGEPSRKQDDRNNGRVDGVLLKKPPHRLFGSTVVYHRSTANSLRDRGIGAVRRQESARTAIGPVQTRRRSACLCQRQRQRSPERGT
jgi:hypothetical protein